MKILKKCNFVNLYIYIVVNNGLYAIYTDYLIDGRHLIANALFADRSIDNRYLTANALSNIGHQYSQDSSWQLIIGS